MLEKLKSLESEESLLGAIINNPDNIGKLNGLLPGHFYISKHMVIFQAIQKIIAKGKIPDLVALIANLKETGKINDVGGAYYITGLSENSFTGANIKQNEKRIIEYWKRGQLYKMLNENIENLESSESKEIAGNILRQLQNIETNNSAGFRHISSYANEFESTFRETYKGKKPRGISTGFYQFDRLAGGLKPSELILIGARPSHGKTALALGIIQNIVKENIPVGLVSLEMSGEQNVGRLAFSLARVSSEVMNTGDISENDYFTIKEKLKKIKKYPLFIDEGTASNSAQLISRASLLRQSHKIRLLVVDYLQLMTAEKAETRNLELGSISRSLKLFAIRERIPVIALCQLSRQAEGRMPNLSCLRDSGALEQDADVVTFIFRPEQCDPSELQNIALIKVAKNRNGSTGEFRLTFLKKFATFENYKEDDERI
ncbi:MAG: replicative DNA helicase [Promethearchaeota archaeon]